MVAPVIWSIMCLYVYLPSWTSHCCLIPNIIGLCDSLQSKTWSGLLRWLTTTNPRITIVKRALNASLPSSVTTTWNCYKANKIKNRASCTYSADRISGALTLKTHNLSIKEFWWMIIDMKRWLFVYLSNLVYYLYYLTWYFLNFLFFYF